jgi:hypothetical protein
MTCMVSGGDRNNLIGSMVQGHSNLTEIKASVELFWRNDVPPSKVVLDTGVYGLSFTLDDPSYNTPGCIFSGAANRGDCNRHLHPRNTYFGSRYTFLGGYLRLSGYTLGKVRSGKVRSGKVRSGKVRLG